jgi:hypothetical protein
LNAAWCGRSPLVHRDGKGMRPRIAFAQLPH